jgi:hypothetical protein
MMLSFPALLSHERREPEEMPTFDGLLVEGVGPDDLLRITLEAHGKALLGVGLGPKPVISDAERLTLG